MALISRNWYPHGDLNPSLQAENPLGAFSGLFLSPYKADISSCISKTYIYFLLSLVVPFYGVFWLIMVSKRCQSQVQKFVVSLIRGFVLTLTHPHPLWERAERRR